MTTVVQSVWLNDVSDAYTVASDWSPSGVPTYDTTNAVEFDITLGGSATSGTAAFTVTSSANEQIGFGWVNANATLDVAAGVFTIFAKTAPYSNLYNLGVVEIDSGATMKFGAAGSPSADSSEIFNNGKVAINGGTLLLAAPWFGLFGTGKVKLSGGTIQSATTGGGNTLQNETDKIVGFGTIGDGSAATGGNGLHLTNTNGGTINANASAALVLNTGSNQIENAGTLETTGTGGLTIDSNMQQDGQLDATGTGALLINNALISGGGNVNVSATGLLTLNNGQLSIGGLVTTAAGGTITTTSGNTVAVGASNSYAGDVLSTTLNNAGTIAIADNSTLNSDSSFLGAGQLRLDGATGPTTLEAFNGGFTLDQTGGLLLSNSAENFVGANGAGEQLSNFSTIAGAGTIGDGYLRLYNAPTGVINADDAVGLTIEGDAAAVTAGTESSNFSAGVIETTGSGGLTLTGVLNNAGYLEAAGAGALLLNGALVNSGGGIVETLGSGSIVLKNNAEIYNQAYVWVSAADLLSTSSGDTSDMLETSVYNSGTIAVANGSDLIADSHWQNSGTIKIKGNTSATMIEIASGKTLQFLGGGTVIMKGADSAIVSDGANTRLFNRDGIIEGAGVVGDANMVVNNTTNGIIDATGATGFTLDGAAFNTATDSSNFYNSGVIQSDSAGGVTIETTIYSPGQLIANTGQINAQDAVYGAGSATINGTGSILFGAEADSNVYFGAGATGSLVLARFPSVLRQRVGFRGGRHNRSQRFRL